MNEFETAWNEAAFLSETEKSDFPRIRPGIIGTLQAFLHYFDEDDSPRSYRLDDIDLSRLSITDFETFERELESLRGKEGQKHFTGTHSYDSDNDIIGQITLEADGTITSNKTGWIFQGKVKAMTFDTYDFNAQTPKRPFPKEEITALARYAGKMFNATDYEIHIPGTANLQGAGTW